MCHGARGLIGPWQTGHAPRQPGAEWGGRARRRPSTGSEGHGGEESDGDGVLPWGSHLTPLSACFLICKMGEILPAPEGRSL